MILARHRLTLLALFPSRMPLLVFAPAAQPSLLTRAAERADPATALVPFERDGGFTVADAGACENAVLEGLDAVDAPAALLARVRAAAPAARLFALVANAASLSSLAHFVSAKPLAIAHPLVREELPPLFAAAGYVVVRIEPLEQDFAEVTRTATSLHLHGLTLDHVRADEEQRLRADAYLAIADPLP